MLEIAAAAAVCVAAAWPAGAQAAFPERPVKLIVPLPTGGSRSTDGCIRQMGD